jgi:PAS domain S-box-containing protein
MISKNKYYRTLISFVPVFVFIFCLKIDVFSSQKTIKVGVYDFTPLVFTQKGKTQGIFVDILNYIAKKENWEIKYIPGTWEETLNRGFAEKVDIVVGIAYDKKRTDRLLFTKEFLFLDWGIVFKKKNTKINTILDLRNKTISAMKASIYTEKFIALLKQFNIRCKILLKKNYVEVFKAVKSKEADAGINTQIYGMLLESKYNLERTSIFFAPTKIRFAVPKNSDINILKTIDAYFKFLKSDKSSVYYKSIDKWLNLYRKDINMPRWIIWLIFSLIALSLIISGFIYTLKKQVHLKTKELKNKNAMLKESEELFRSLFYGAPIGMILFTAEGENVITNASAVKMLGYEKNEIHNISLSQLTNPENPQNELAIFKEFFSNRSDSYKSIRKLYTKENKGIWASLTISAAKTDENNTKYIFVMIEDISQNKTTQEELKKSEEKYRRIFANILDVYYRADAGGILRDISPSGVKLLKYTSQEDILGKSVHEVLYKNTADREKLIQTINSEGKAINFPITLEDKNGTEIYCETNSKPIYDENGKLCGVDGIIRDVSEKKRIEKEKEKLIIKLKETLEKEQATGEELNSSYEELEQSYAQMELSQIELENALLKANEANKMKQELLALMSHELRTPLAGIIGFADLLKKEIEESSLPDDLSSSYINKLKFVLKSSMRLNEVLTNLLELSSAVAGREIIINIEKLNIREMLNDISILLEGRFKEQNNNFYYNINTDDFIYSDPLRIQQILLNLIGNATKFTESGNVSVRVYQKDNFYHFEIKDTGIGIDKKNQENIFDLFKQIDSSISRKYQGVGIGLSVCKRFVEALGGHISVESETEKGSTFYFSVPAREPLQTEITLADKKDTKDNVIKKSDSIKILFAEDDEINHKFLKGFFKKINIDSAKGFFNGKDLLEEYKTDNDCSLIILDIQMPLMDGIQCLKEIRKINTDIPVFALTAFSMKSDKDKYLKEGFTDYISKPIDTNHLADIIKNI